MPSTTMPAGGGVEYNGQWYTTQEWAQMGGAAGAGGSAAQQQTVDGRQLLQNFLNQYGLSGIDINTAWQAYVASGSNMDYWTNIWLPTTKAFQTAYPAYQQLMQQGRGITVQQYRDYINTMQQTAQAAGMPKGTISQDTITSWLEGDVSASEGVQRIQDASKAVYQLDKNSQDYLQFREAGFSDGDLAAVWFDPKTALPLLENKLAAAQIGGAARGAGFDLSTDVADQLVRQGVSGSQAQGGFNKLANDQQLTTALPGQQGSTMSQAQQVAGEFGTSASAAQQLANTAAARKAVFSAGGGFAGNQTGYSGIGAAKSA